MVLNLKLTLCKVYCSIKVIKGNNNEKLKILIIAMAVLLSSKKI